MINHSEKYGSAEAELPESAKEAINFVLGYQPYRCYDAAPRILAVLLKNGASNDGCRILTSPKSRHYWVRAGFADYSTADLSNLRGSPTADEKCTQLTEEALKHATEDDAQDFEKWVYDKSGEFQKQQDILAEELKNPRVH